MRMKYVTFLLSVLMISSSCDKTDDSQGDVTKLSFFADSKIMVNSNPGTYMKYAVIESGENLVFEYRFDAEDDEQIADDEYSETIRFEVASNLDEFSFIDTGLNTIKSTFTKYCFCYFENSEEKNVPPKGSISGKKISDSKWDITIDVTFYGDEQKQLQGIFHLK